MLINKELYYVSNLISLSRFILAPITAYLAFGQHYILAIIFIIIIWLTDITDGYIARKRKEISELGKLIDPLADKFSIILIAFVLLMQDLLPVWFFLAIVIRDILILSGGLLIKLDKRKLMMSNYTGKITVFLIGFTLINLILQKYFEKTNSYDVNVINLWELINNVLIFISLVMIVVSFSIYLYRFFKIKE